MYEQNWRANRVPPILDKCHTPLSDIFLPQESFLIAKMTTWPYKTVDLAYGDVTKMLFLK